jgi:hypothetical protein
MFGCYGEETYSSLTDGEAHSVNRTHTASVAKSKAKKAVGHPTGSEQTDASLNIEAHS